ncbi:MAG: helix-turn-helix transcriptional regulator [Phycisphaeraceae bacterium]|nr:helix-turn-helix transcriptional regulator [Phycisphaeraceae bacterium]
MSIMRQPGLRLSDERFLVVRTMVARCAAGVRTTSFAENWHRLIAAGEGVMIVRTPQGSWSVPASNAVWVPAGVRHELEVCVETAMRVFYLRASKAARGKKRSGTAELPDRCCSVLTSPLLREALERIAAMSALDGRVSWHGALVEIVRREVCEGAREPRELVWPADGRVARVASVLQANPGDRRKLAALCRGRGVSVRTVQRLFPVETGLTFEKWRQRQRHLHAGRLLARGVKVATVAEECGYRSVSAFVSAFRHEAGVTPGEFARAR